MGMAADTIERLTGVKPKDASGPAPQYDLDSDASGMAADTLRRALGQSRPAPTFSDRFSPAEEQPLQKGSLPKPKQPGFEWSQAVTDIPSEIRKEAQSSVDDVTALSRRGEMGPIEGLTATGKAAVAPLRFAASPITGAARSLIGHTMANLEHRAGEVIAPDIAAKDNPGQMYETAKGDVDTALSAARVKAPTEAVESALNKAKAAPRSIADLKKSASAGYEHPDLVDLQVKPQAVQDFAVRSESLLNKHGLDDITAPKTVAILRRAQKIPDDPDAVSTGQNLVSLRRSLQHAAEQPEEKAAASMAIDHLDGWLPTIDKAQVISGNPEAAADRLFQANKDYSAAMHAGLVDKKLLRAELRSASAHSGMGVTNQVRGRMADILLSDKEKRGFTDDELGQMEKIVYGTTKQNVLRSASNVLSGGGGVGSTLLGLMTGGTFPALGMALRWASNRITVGQAEKLSEMIRSRPGLTMSAQKFEEAASAFNQGRTAKSVAGINIAARNLSNNLKGAGINIAPADLLRQLQSPATGSAEDQENVPGPPGK